MIFVPYQKINGTCSISGILFAIIYFEVLEQLDYETKTYFDSDIKRQGLRFWSEGLEIQSQL